MHVVQKTELFWTLCTTCQIWNLGNRFICYPYASRFSFLKSVFQRLLFPLCSEFLGVRTHPEPFVVYSAVSLLCNLSNSVFPKNAFLPQTTPQILPEVNITQLRRPLRGSLGYRTRCVDISATVQQPSYGPNYGKPCIAASPITLAASQRTNEPANWVWISLYAPAILSLNSRNINTRRSTSG